MSTLKFPISICLVGAPGSGKQALAEEFEKISADYFAGQDSPFTVIHNSGNFLQDDADTPMGAFGGWAESLRAYYLQFEAEQEARLNGVSFLSLGTPVTNLSHAAVTLESILQGLQTPDAMRRAQQTSAAMALLSYLFMERFWYTFAFYVPGASSVVLPGADDTERQYNQRVDMALRTAFVNFGARIQPLDQPTVEEKAEVMFETIKRIVENGPETPAAEEPEESEGEIVPPEVESTLAE